MAVGKSDLGILGDLAVALGIFTPGGSPDPDWFCDPAASLKTMLSNADQRRALIAFVDDALGGADRTTEGGVIWLPVVAVDDPPLVFALTIDEGRPDGLHVGLGVRVRTAAPAPVSNTTLSIPLFRVKKDGGPGGDRAAAAGHQRRPHPPRHPGHARCRARGAGAGAARRHRHRDRHAHRRRRIRTSRSSRSRSPACSCPARRRRATCAWPPTAPTSSTTRCSTSCSASSRRRRMRAGAPPAIAALGGLLGLEERRRGARLPDRRARGAGPDRARAWVRGIFTNAPSRSDWLGHLASLLGAAPGTDRVSVHARQRDAVVLGLKLDTGPSGNARLTPTLGVELGNADDARRGARPTCSASTSSPARPSRCRASACGPPPAAAANRVLDVTAPDRRARRHAARRLRPRRRSASSPSCSPPTACSSAPTRYPTLDLTSPDAVMDAVGNTVGRRSPTSCSRGLGDALGVARRLLGLDAPAGVGAVTLPALMADPVAAVAGYWQQLIAVPAAASTVLGELRGAIADASEAAAVVQGAGTRGRPVARAAHRPAAARGVVVGSTAAPRPGRRHQRRHARPALHRDRDALRGALAEHRPRRAQRDLLPGVAASLTARERGVNPPQARLELGGGLALRGRPVGLRLGWTPATRLTAGLERAQPGARNRRRSSCRSRCR